MTTALTIAAAFLAVLFGCALADNKRLEARNRSLQHQIEALEEQRGQYLTSAADEDAIYMSLITDDGRLYIDRASVIEGHIYHTFIKSFTDEDTEFNQREAEELCEILNSK